MKDDNELLQAGELPEDLEADCVPIETPPGEQEAAPLEDLRLGAFVGDCAARMQRRKAGEELPIHTPWKAVDTALRGGLWPGLAVLVGNAGTGKTQWALQLALHAARAEIPALYIGLELDKLGFAARLMALQYRKENNVRLQWSDLYVGRDPEGGDPELLPTMDEVITATEGDLAALPLYLELGPPGGWSVSQLEERVEELRTDYPKERGPVLVVLDFLQLVGDDPGTRAELRERIGQAAYAGRRIAREHDAAVLLVSSTARTQYKLLDGTEEPLGDKDPRAYLGAGKESGEIEYAADVALTLCREKWTGGTPPPVYLAVAKVRAGVPSWVVMDFDGCVFGNDREPTEGEDNGDDGGDDGLI